jgi:hypothetical protein
MRKRAAEPNSGVQTSSKHNNKKATAVRRFLCARRFLTSRGHGQTFHLTSRFFQPSCSRPGNGADSTVYLSLLKEAFVFSFQLSKRLG